METTQSLFLEIKKLKRIIFDLQERSREDYLTYEEGLSFDSAMDDLQRGNIFTKGDIQNERKKAGLEI